VTSTRNLGTSIVESTFGYQSSSQRPCAAPFCVRELGKQILRSPVAVRACNAIYENGGDAIQDLFCKATDLSPPRSFEWRIKLENGRWIRVPVRSGDIKSWEFARAYQWSDRSLRRIESELFNRLPATARLFDVGANMGLRSLYAMSQRRPVTMFEPNIELRGFTEELISLNGGNPESIIVNVCVGAEPSSVKFYVSPTSYLSSLDRDHAAQEGAVRVVEVSMTTINDYVADAADQRRFGVMKIDVEGAEIEVLKGAQHSIASFRPALIIEIQPNNLEGLDGFLEARKYQGFGIVEKTRRLMVPVSQLQNSDAPPANFLYLPRECRVLSRDMAEVVR
jgi:FkbM family methyltransferase